MKLRIKGAPDYDYKARCYSADMFPIKFFVAFCEEIQGSNDSIAQAYPYTEGTCAVILSRDGMAINIIVHEITHLVDYTEDYLGPLGPEGRAYLAGWFAKQVCKAVIAEGLDITLS